MTFRIELPGCINCGWCRRECPTATIQFFLTGHRTHVVEPSGCIDCGICAKVCPVNVIAYDPTYVHHADELAAAKDRARDWARRRRQTKLQRRARAAAALQQLAARAEPFGTPVASVGAGSIARRSSQPQSGEKSAHG